MGTLFPRLPRWHRQAVHTQWGPLTWSCWPRPQAAPLPTWEGAAWPPRTAQSLQDHPEAFQCHAACNPGAWGRSKQGVARRCSRWETGENQGGLAPRGRRLEFIELEIVDALPQRWTTVVRQAFCRASCVHAPSRQPCTCHTFCPPQLTLVSFSLILLGSI